MTAAWPHVSVIVPVLDRAALIGRLLDSLLAQDYPRGRYDVTVIDNGSSDGTQRVVSRYPVTLIEERGTRSSYAARNRGIEASRGDVLAFTDSDCLAAPDWLRALVAECDEPSDGAFAGELAALEPKTVVERFLAQRKMGHRAALAHPYLPYATTANVAYRRAVFERIGGFNPRLRSGGDVDLCWRMQKETPYRLAYRPRALVYHRNRASVAALYQQFALYGEGFAHLELLHADLYARFSHGLGLPRVQALRRFVRRQALERRPSWMRPTSRFDALTMWLLEGVVKIAYDRGIRRGRRNREVILDA